MHAEKLEYHDGNFLLEAYVAYDNKHSHSRPAVLVAHDWSGRNEFACQKAEQLAALGYVGFALDMYGKGKLGETNEEKMQLIKPFKENRQLLRQRITAGLNAAKKLTMVNTSQIAAMGFCFGGLCALDLARSGADIRGVVSFHGLLDAPVEIPNAAIKAKVLALHGHDDPMVPPSQVAIFEKEMTEAQVDWQLHIYGHTKHAFTNPLANDSGLGLMYEAKADQRSWIAAKNFFTEIFSK